NVAYAGAAIGGAGANVARLRAVRRRELAHAARAELRAAIGVLLAAVAGGLARAAGVQTLAHLVGAGAAAAIASDRARAVIGHALTASAVPARANQTAAIRAGGAWRAGLRTSADDR